jgi:hypothetical protein
MGFGGTLIGSIIMELIDWRAAWMKYLTLLVQIT